MNKIITLIITGLSLAITPFAASVFAVEPCEPVLLVSDITNTVVGDGNAVAVTPVGAWTAVIPGSTTWIWKASATTPNEIVAFEKSFTVVGSTTSAILDIASDNSYKVFIDNVQVAADASATNFTLATQDTHNLTAFATTTGTHTLRIEVKNNGTFNAQTNPAGLLYKFVVESDCCSGDDEGDTLVVNENEAIVINEVGSSANTGDNSSSGGSAGSAGNGGSVVNSGDNNTGGNGGASGNGGNGGSVTTGDAGATTVVGNNVNYNNTEINRCGCCCGDTLGNDTVLNNNGALVLTGAGAGANSGTSNTNGGSAGSSGNGGSVTISDDNNTGGNAGNAGNGGTGGSIHTGAAVSLSSMGNFVNTNITRIRR